jgi:hypothetical protein
MTRRAFTLALTLLLSAPVTLAAQQAQQAESARPDSLFPEPPLSPGGAFIRSLVIPGWAQAELGAEARGALYFFAEAFSLFMVARTQIRLSHAERNLPEDDPLVQGRRQQREDWIAMAVFWSFFAAADGWISVHLYGFDERTGLEPEQVAFGITFRIPLGP